MLAVKSQQREPQTLEEAEAEQATFLTVAEAQVPQVAQVSLFCVIQIHLTQQPRLQAHLQSLRLAAIGFINLQALEALHFKE